MVVVTVLGSVALLKNGTSRACPFRKLLLDSWCSTAHGVVDLDVEEVEDLDQVRLLRALLLAVRPFEYVPAAGAVLPDLALDDDAVAVHVVPVRVSPLVGQLHNYGAERARVLIANQRLHRRPSVCILCGAAQAELDCGEDGAAVRAGDEIRMPAQVDGNLSSS